MRLKDKTIIVTGGGNGLGRELVFNLLRKGNNVIAFDINEAALKETEKLMPDNFKRCFATLKLDITDLQAVKDSVEKSITFFGQVDCIINNAGIVQPFIKIIDTDFSIMKKVYEINFGGTMYMIKAYLPYLLERPNAHIVNISSMGGFLPVPGQAIYGASKAAVKILTECLSSELSETNVKVTLVIPGAIFTNIKSNSGLSDKDGKNASDYEKIPRGTISPAKAAEQITKSIEHDKVRVLVGKDSKIMNFLYQRAPSFASRLIYKKMKQHHNL